MSIDITVYPKLSPRVVVVDYPQTEASVQDIVNAVRAWEDTWEGQAYPYLIDAAGKEDLGGGTTVGITATFRNTQLRFAARPVPLSTGTVTTGSGTGQVLTDSGADFIADGIYVGCTAINETTNAMETVVSIDPGGTEIISFPLQAGTRQDWQIGDSYSVYPNELCNISGGNLVAVDDVGASIDPILQAPNVLVVRSSASSATNTDLEAIQYSTYQNAVWIDPNSFNSGTTYPVGNREFPVNNLSDAIAIANDKGFKTLQILDDMLLNSGTNITNFKIIGESHVNTHITMDSSAQCEDVIIENCFIEGVLDGGTTIDRCVVGAISYVNGHIHNCGLTSGPIVLDGTEDAILVECHQLGTDPAVVDMGGSGQNLSVTQYAGGIQIENLTSPAYVIAVGLASGRVILDSSITAGEVVVAGPGVLENNATNLTFLDTQGLLSKETITEITWDTVWVDTISGSSGTDFPAGTRKQPVDNMTDAKAIALVRGIEKIHFHGSETLSEGMAGFVIEADSTFEAAIDVNGQDIEKASFYRIQLSGVFNGTVSCEESDMADGITGLQGSFSSCVFRGELTPLQVPGTVLTLGNCVSGGLSTVIHASGGVIIVGTGFSGQWILEDSVIAPAPSVAQLEFASGKLTIDSTCIGGFVDVAGIVVTTDNSGAGCLVVRDGQIQASPEAYAGAIWINTSSPDAGQLYPVGTPSRPVNNISDALALALDLNIKHINYTGMLILPQDVEGFTFTGIGDIATNIIVASGQSLDGSFFERVTLTGLMTGSANYVQSFLHDLSGVAGIADNSALSGTITLGGIGTYLQGKSLASASQPTVIDMVGAGRLFQAEINGQLEFRNAGVGSSMSFGGDYGEATLDSSCVGGTLSLQGGFTLDDQSGGAVTVVDSSVDGRHGSGSWEGAGTAGDIADAVWDEILTGATHNIPTSAGRRLRAIASQVIITGTAVDSGIGSNQIELDNDASTVDGAYDPSMLAIVDGVGAGQSRLILQYEGSTKTATVDRDWKTLPDDTSEYVISGHPGREHVNEGLAQAGAAATITLNALASDTDDSYNRQSVFIRSGTGEDQVRTVKSYDGTTKIATIDEDWNIIPDSTSGYVLLPTREHTTETLYDMYWTKVYVDTVDGVAGTEFPIGTAGNPVNNIAEAKIIADARNIKEFSVIGAIALHTDFEGYYFGNHGGDTVIDLNNQSVEDAVFDTVILTGVQNGRIHANVCSLLNLVGMEGEYRDSVIRSDLDCKTGVWTHLWSGQAVAATRYNIDMNGGALVGIAETVLVCQVQNMTSPSSILLKHGQGQVTGDSSNTNGSIRLGGEASWNDAGVGVNVSVVDDTTRVVTAEAVWEEDPSDHDNDGTMGGIFNEMSNMLTGRFHITNNQMIFYEDDNLTEVARFDLTDESGNPSMANVFERVRV
jgi:hypothetical protein